MNSTTTAAIVAVVAAVAAAASAVFALIQARVADAARAAEFDAAFVISWRWEATAPDAEGRCDWTGRYQVWFANVGREDAYSLFIRGRFYRRWLGPWPRMHADAEREMPGAPEPGQKFRFRWNDSHGYKRRQNVIVPERNDPRQLGPSGGIPQRPSSDWRGPQPDH